MNEADTRAEYIDPALRASGWGVVEGSKILRELFITPGRIQAGGVRAKPEYADYVLVYKNRKIGVVEAKPFDAYVSEGVGQAKGYADKLNIDYTYSSNGREIYQISMKSGQEGLVERFPTPDELWLKTFTEYTKWQEAFAAILFDESTGKKPYYYQEIAINKVLDAIAQERNRILLTLATGTGKTFIAFQIAWKLFHARWNLHRDGQRRPRILFLADRNNLANQAMNDFSPFGEDPMVRIDPKTISKKGRVPTSGSIFFTIFQTFMSGLNNTPYFGAYPPDFFDLIIIDECHRGGANDEGTWRGILEYFSPAVQLGLTATPKRKDNADTYRYFGDPVYIYSLKQGINDGFLTPFKVKRIQTTLDDYIYTSDDTIIEGEIEQGRLYTEADFNRIIEIKEREAKRVELMLEHINQNEKTIPTILTTSQKLSTGVDAKNVRNIVLMRPVNSLIEFKQIVGRGTRLFDGKEYFTIYDFVNAYQHFADPTWDGEPLDETTEEYILRGPRELAEGSGETQKRQKVRIRLGNGKEREIQHMISTSFWSIEGKPISLQEFLNKLFGTLPEFFKNEDELRLIWSSPKTRTTFLDQIAKLGYGKEELKNLQIILDASKSDLFDVLNYISFLTPPVLRTTRVEKTKNHIFEDLGAQEKEFLDFVLAKYEDNGVEELSEDKLPMLLALKYHSAADGLRILGNVEKVRYIFFHFQEKLYAKTQL